MFRQQPQVQLKHLQRLQQQLQPQQQHQRQGYSNDLTFSTHSERFPKLLLKY